MKKIVIEKPLTKLVTVGTELVERFEANDGTIFMTEREALAHDTKLMRQAWNKEHRLALPDLYNDYDDPDEFLIYYLATPDDVVHLYGLVLDVSTPLPAEIATPGYYVAFGTLGSCDRTKYELIPLQKYIDIVRVSAEERIAKLNQVREAHIDTVNKQRDNVI